MKTPHHPLGDATDLISLRERERWGGGWLREECWVHLSVIRTQVLSKSLHLLLFHLASICIVSVTFSICYDDTQLRIQCVKTFQWCLSVYTLYSVCVWVLKGFHSSQSVSVQSWSFNGSCEEFLWYFFFKNLNIAASHYTILLLQSITRKRCVFVGPESVHKILFNFRKESRLTDLTLALVLGSVQWVGWFDSGSQ